jgi:hypothetical protein
LRCRWFAGFERYERAYLFPRFPSDADADTTANRMLSVWRLQVGDTYAFMITAHVLLNPIRVIVVPLGPMVDSSGDSHDVRVLQQRNGHLNFATLFEWVAQQLDSDFDADTCLSATMMSWEVYDWDSLRIIGEAGGAFKLGLVASTQGSAAARIASENKLFEQMQAKLKGRVDTKKQTGVKAGPSLGRGRVKPVKRVANASAKAKAKAKARTKAKSRAKAKVTPIAPAPPLPIQDIDVECEAARPGVPEGGGDGCGGDGGDGDVAVWMDKAASAMDDDVTRLGPRRRFSSCAIYSRLPNSVLMYRSVLR